MEPDRTPNGAERPSAEEEAIVQRQRLRANADTRLQSFVAWILVLVVLAVAYTGMIALVRAL